eukprot:11134230-Ditylum_brightwellii.AAC.1
MNSQKQKRAEMKTKNTFDEIQKDCNDTKNSFTNGGTGCLTGCEEGENVKKFTSKKVVYCNVPNCGVRKDS